MTRSDVRTEPRPLDLAGTPGVPLPRLVGVELRKMADTRSGRWLLGAIVAITALILVIFYFFAEPESRTFLNLIGITATPQGFLLPVLGILLITSEWGQRTALTTFTLVPRRGRVVAAKVAAALLLGLAAIIVALALATLAAVLGGAGGPWAGIGVGDLGKFGLLQLSGILQGLAFADAVPELGGGDRHLLRPAGRLHHRGEPVVGTGRRRPLGGPRHRAVGAVHR